VAERWTPLDHASLANLNTPFSCGNTLRDILTLAMAHYASVAQAERDAFSDGSPSVHAISPTLEYGPNRRISDSFEQLSTQTTAKSSMPQQDNRVGSMLRSIASSQSVYEMVENDDYEEHQVHTLSTQNKGKEVTTPPVRQDEVLTDVDRTPMRTASISRDLPLNHPKSLQGTQDRNVARLEESAERLSMTSGSSLEEELHRMKHEQRRPERQSSTSTTSSIHRNGSRQYSNNSIIGVNSAARSGGYSPAGYITSPRGSIREGTWLQAADRQRSVSQTTSQSPPSVPQHYDLGFSQRNLNLDFGQGPDLNPAPQPPPHSHQTGVVTRESILQQGQPPRIEEDLQEPPEPRTSTDTSREARDLFNDFDGVHHALTETRGHSRRISLTRPPLASNGTAHEEPQPGQNMVYYPAPVPMMLNLPQRLSKMQDLNDRERRRLQALSVVPPEMRSSAPWLKEQDEAPLDARRNTQTLNYLPPQLRASAFFDRPSAQQDMKLVNSSAVATLDSLLDASAHAPVSAFTDHPIAGRLGGEVYGMAKNQRDRDVVAKVKVKKVKRQSSLSNMLKMGSTFRGSRMGAGAGDVDAEDDEDVHARSSNGPDGPDLIAPSDDEDERNDDEDEEQYSEDEDAIDDHRAYLGPPTTLLAELQMRKTAQKSRTRTAADTFPNGMHSTLLELDAVTQLQQKSRKLKHVTLAWEDHEETDREKLEDEDVPLGILFQGKKAAAMDSNRPMGLMEKRDMEDNEPLSRRRARLRGEPLPSQAAASIRPDNQSAFYSLGNPTDSKLGRAEAEEENEGETLGQRKARLAAEKAEKSADVGADFAHEVASQLGLPEEEVPTPSKAPEVEETLAQRKKRLQQDQPANQRQTSGQSQQSRHSMADILQAHPAAGAGRPSAGAMGPRPGFYPSQSYVSQGQGNANAFVPTSFPRFPPTHTNPLYNPAMGIQAGAVYGIPPYTQDLGMGPPLDPRQRDQIDRWRQSIHPGA
jgi:hypothetical protein